MLRACGALNIGLRDVVWFVFDYVTTCCVLRFEIRHRYSSVNRVNTVLTAVCDLKWQVGMNHVTSSCVCQYAAIFLLLLLMVSLKPDGQYVNDRRRSSRATGGITGGGFAYFSSNVWETNYSGNV
jgi:hypothetical protein